jgi:hypothetical protein
MQRAEPTGICNLAEVRLPLQHCICMILGSGRASKCRFTGRVVAMTVVTLSLSGSA